MPWIKKEDCVGCGICVEECPVDTVYMEDKTAKIDMSGCIRCGKCHDACPQEAVRHDSERIPLEVEENIEWAKKLMERYYETSEEKKSFIERVKKHFNKEKQIAEKSIKKLDSIEA